MNHNKTIIAAVACAAASLTGCATNTGYKNAFSGDPAMENSHTYDYGADVIDLAMSKTLAERGFQVDQAQGNHVEVVNSYKEKQDSDTTFRIRADISTVRLGDHSTQVNIAAQQKTVLRTTSHTWFHLIFIPIIPTGTVHRTHITSSGTITDKKFYSEFFSSLQNNINQIDNT